MLQPPPGAGTGARHVTTYLLRRELEVQTVEAQVVYSRRNTSVLRRFLADQQNIFIDILVSPIDSGAAQRLRECELELLQDELGVPGVGLNLVPSIRPSDNPIENLALDLSSLAASDPLRLDLVRACKLAL